MIVGEEGSRVGGCKIYKVGEVLCDAIGVGYSVGVCM